MLMKMLDCMATAICSFEPIGARADSGDASDAACAGRISKIAGGRVRLENSSRMGTKPEPGP